MMKNILKAGDRIQISSLKKNLAGEQGPVLMSRIADIEDSGELIVEMPMHQGKIILLSLGARYEFVFYTKRGPYRGTCQVVDRYKEENNFLVKVELKNGLHKFQRREYFRLECSLEMITYDLTSDEAKNLSQEQLDKLIREPDVIMTMAKAVIVDISGGGLRFISEKKFEDGDYAAVQLKLANDNIDLDILTPISIIACRQAAPYMERYEARGEFMHLDTELREMIIKYIFDEERKIRRKDMGI